MNKWFAGCDNVKLFELHKNGQLARACPQQGTWSGSVALDNNVLSDSDETNIHCLRNSLNSVLNDILKKDPECDTTYCDDGHIYNICPALFDFRKRFTQNFIFAHININSFRH